MKPYYNNIFSILTIFIFNAHIFGMASKHHYKNETQNEIQAFTKYSNYDEKLFFYRICEFIEF